MEYRENKRLNARVSLLGFGGMRFPTDGEGKIREAEAAGMLRRAMEGGVNYFDTAHYYHDSQSEGFLGRTLAGVPRDSYYLATKLPVWKVESVSDAQAIFDLQLERLRTGYFDFYLFHALDRKRWQAVKEQDLVEWAEELQRQGKIRRLGFSFHDSYEAFEEILTARQWDFCQLQLNYLDTEEQAGLKGYHLAERMGVPVVVMEPVKGGLLAAPPEEVEELLRTARPERTPAGWALRWAASLPGVLTVLSGMGSMAQVEENLATFAGPGRQMSSAGGSTTAAPVASTACPAPPGWISRRTSACGTNWPSAGTPLCCGAPGTWCSRTRPRESTVWAAAGARRFVPSTCPSGRIWPGLRQHWTLSPDRELRGQSAI